MIVRRNQMNVDEKVDLRGGTGTLYFTRLAPPETFRHAKTIAEVRMPPDCSIGFHKHEDETEFYIILSGSGVANDNGKEFPIKAGDVMITGNGSSHGLKNTGKKDLVYQAIVLS
ncbi:MAG: cupin domain-containing protein [Termitinemataceae bacterium]|nr:MAG: cupin domain-containing protein [Termitinemataceae bacterium]